MGVWRGGDLYFERVVNRTRCNFDTKLHAIATDLSSRVAISVIKERGARQVRSTRLFRAGLSSTAEWHIINNSNFLFIRTRLIKALHEIINKIYFTYYFRIKRNDRHTDDLWIKWLYYFVLLAECQIIYLMFFISFCSF